MSEFDGLTLSRRNCLQLGMSAGLAARASVSEIDFRY